MSRRKRRELIFSATPLRSLRLGGESYLKLTLYKSL